MRKALTPPLLSTFAAASFLLATVAGAVPMRAAYVIGSSDGSVARIDLDSGVVTPALLSVGSSANRIEVEPGLAWAAVANSGSDDVTVIDLLSESVLHHVALPTGTNPWAVEVAPGGALFVSSLLRDVVYLVDPLANVVLDSVAVGKAPEGMTITDGRLYVANSGFDFDTFEYDPGTVSVVELSSLSVVQTIPVSLNPQECLLAPDGTVHVIATGDFFATMGAIDVVDPATDTVVSTLPVTGFPGGGCVSGGRVLLNVTTPSFGSEIHGYDPATLAWIWDDSNPLLPSFDFYGNLRATADGLLAVPDFSADLLLLEAPDSPGSPTGYFVGDGPIDVAVVERDEPVPVRISGVAARADAEGVHLRWAATLEAGVTSFVVERAEAGGDAWSRVADDLAPARTNRWTDKAAPVDVALRYRIGARDAVGDVQWTPPVDVIRAAVARRLAVQRVTPNPSRGAVVFTMAAPQSGIARLEIHDVTGRRVLSRDVPLIAGEPTVAWDGRGDSGAALPPGAYFARWTLGGQTADARILRLR
jgi:YVTN family beta-propeller protein